jgi:hypothetical protein
VQLGGAVTAVSSPTHGKQIESSIAGSSAQIVLTQPTLMDKVRPPCMSLFIPTVSVVLLNIDAGISQQDFVLVVTPADPQRPRGLLQRDGAGRTALYAALMPPAADDATPCNREIVFVVDRSGSMNNGAIQARFYLL